MDRREFLKGSAAGVAAAATAGCDAAPRRPAKPYRYIDQELCVGCGRCVPLCPVGAIKHQEKSRIEPDECTECGVCYRSRVCPVEAIIPGNLAWPRTLRETFSNPLTEHKSTGVAGRGTEGIKTNDSTGRYRRGSIGVFVELGRPVLGTRFTDVERVVKKFTARGYPVMKDNPVAELIADPKTGALLPEILHERALSVLVEFIIPEAAAHELMGIIAELAEEVDTVFNVSVALPADLDGMSPLHELFGAEVFSLPAGKVNLGLAAGISRKEKG